MIRPSALIVGAGSGLSGSLARLLASEGFGVALAARNPGKLAGFEAMKIACDATDRAQVEAAFDAVGKAFGVPDLVVYNASTRVRGPFAELDPQEVARTVEVTAMGGFHVAQAAVRRMLPRGSGAVFFTGASASVKGYAQSAPFAMGKFALRGLAQSLARELHPKGLHIAHFVIDGGIRKAGDPRAAERGEDGLLDPDAIAAAYLQFYRQDRSAWAWELELRPWLEKF